MNMNPTELDGVLNESWHDSALIEEQIKVEIYDELVKDVSLEEKETSVLSLKNTASNEASVLSNIEKNRLQPQLGVFYDGLPVKAEENINGHQLTECSSDSDDCFIEDFQLKTYIKSESTSSEGETGRFLFGKSSEDIISESFAETKFIIQEEVVIKSENEGSDQSNINKLEGEEIIDEHLDELKYIIPEEIFIKDEVEEEDQFNTRYGASTTKKGERKYCWDECSYETQKKYHLVRHISVHDKVNAPKYSCNHCPYQTIDKSNLRRHLRMHYCFGLICILCQMSFKRKSSLDAHYISRHPDRSDKWGSIITNKIKECPKCPYKTVRSVDLKIHLATHRSRADQAQFKCNICEYKFTRKSHFTTHLRIHVGQLPFVCTECDKRFNRKVQLDCHLLSRHSDNEELVSSVTSKVHQCDNCNYKTVINSNLKHHSKSCLFSINTLVSNF